MVVDNLNQGAGTEMQPNTPTPVPNQTNESPEGVATAAQSFGELLEAIEDQASSFHTGDLVTGKVIQLTEQSAVIDIGYKTEGVVPLDELKSAPEEIRVGDDIPVIIRQWEGPDGYVQLSYRDALQKQAWQKIEVAATAGTAIKGRIIERVKGGLKVNLGGVEAFLPASQVDTYQVRNLDAWKGKEIEARILKLSKKQSNIVISRRVLIEEEQARVRESVLSTLDEGYVVQGRIKSLADYGAFVDLGGIDGLLHITDMAFKRIAHPKDLFKVGDVLQVKVLKLDREKGRVNLGFKQLLPDPWDTVAERYPAGSRVRGKVTRLVNYGAFVELEDGIEGLIHVSEMTWDKKQKHPSKYLKPEEEVVAEVIAVDPKERRVSLSLRHLQPDPWQLFAETHAPGTRLRGIVRGLTDFGAFVEVEKGIEGLVHVSDITRQRIKHPSEMLKKGQTVEVVVQQIDLAQRKMSLSMKELEADPWQEFFDKRRVGDVLKGKIARLASFGAFVDLGSGVEGLCHISELSEERVEKPGDVVHVGQELEFRILKLDPGQRRIGLSTRAVGEKAEPPGYTVNEDTGRIASLGELIRRDKDKAE
jgi:small subunit ribosomal protein S1